MEDQLRMIKFSKAKNLQSFGETSGVEKKNAAVNENVRVKGPSRTKWARLRDQNVSLTFFFSCRAKR